jgi:integrase
MIGKTKDGVFFFSVRYKDALGKSQQKYQQNRSWRTKKEAKQAADAFLLTATRQATGLTMDELFARFIEDAKLRLKPFTAYTYEKVYTSVLREFFGDMIVADITPRHIVAWQGDILRKGYANGSLSGHQTMLRIIFNYAVRNDIIPSSPFRSRSVSDKSQRKPEVEYWTPREFTQFIEQVQDFRVRAFFELLYWTGLRRGEAMALTIDDLDFANGTLRVNKTYNPLLKTTTSPKTNNSYREIQLSAELLNTLKTLVIALQTNPTCCPTSYLFYLDKPYYPRFLQDEMKKACKASGVKHIKIHALRHSHVSLLISMGFTPFEIAKRMGHAVSMVEEVYGHWFKDSQRNMVEKLDQVAREMNAPTSDRYN